MVSNPEASPCPRPLACPRQEVPLLWEIKVVEGCASHSTAPMGSFQDLLPTGSPASNTDRGIDVSLGGVFIFPEREHNGPQGKLWKERSRTHHHPRDFSALISSPCPKMSTWEENSVPTWVFGKLGPQTLVFPTFPARQKRRVRLVGMAGDYSHTFRDGGSEVVPSQEAAGISEGWGAGASGLAAWSLRDVAVAVVIAVIRRAEMVLAD